MQVEQIPAEFAVAFEKTAQEFAEKGTFFLENAYINQVHEMTGAFPQTLNVLLEEAEKIRADALASQYALFVLRAMEDREAFLKHLALFTFPEEYPLFAFYCLIPSIVDLQNALQARGLPADVIAQTVGQYEDCIFLHEQRFDELGLCKRYFNHLQLYVDQMILNIGRLRFEKAKIEDPLYVLEHKETGKKVILFAAGQMRKDGLYADTPPVAEEGQFVAQFSQTEDAYIATPILENGKCSPETKVFAKKDYQLLIQQGDQCLSVHIPNKGELTQEACKASYERAAQLFRTCYPELQIKGMFCHSWMLAPELQTILSPNSKIIQFQNDYVKYPIHTEGEDVLNFVFNLKFKTYADLPEETSLQRKLKAMYVAGEYLYEYGGIFCHFAQL